MSRNPIAKQFAKFYSQMLSERKRLEHELAQIVEALGHAGSAFVQTVRRGRKPKALKAVKGAKKAGRPRRKRQRFDLTAEEFVLKMVGDAGQLTTAQVNEQWKKARSGSANNALTKLSKDKRLAKLENPGGRGSIFKLPG